MEVKLKILLLLQLISFTVILFIVATVRAGEEVEYVRPPPRKAFHLPWDPKLSSQPQQVKEVFILTRFQFVRLTFLFSRFKKIMIFPFLAIV